MKVPIPLIISLSLFDLFVISVRSFHYLFIIVSFIVFIRSIICSLYYHLNFHIGTRTIMITIIRLPYINEVERTLQGNVISFNYQHLLPPQCSSLLTFLYVRSVYSAMKICKAKLQIRKPVKRREEKREEKSCVLFLQRSRQRIFAPHRQDHRRGRQKSIGAGIGISPSEKLSTSYPH